jgi:uncharacterized LabA/DUF88 family protein
MTSVGSPPSPQKKRVIAYVDGFNLYYGLKKASRDADREHLKHGGDRSKCLGRSLYWLDVKRFMLRQVRAQEACTQIRYYSAPRRIPESVAITRRQRAGFVASNERQRVYLEALRTLEPDLKVVLGWYTENEPHHCWMCGHRRAHFEEKETDVNIAVDMVTHAHQNLFDTAIVLSADADLAPALKVVRSYGKQVRLILAPGRKRADLLRSLASEVVVVKIRSLRNFILPDPIARVGFPSISCPEEWKQPADWVWGGRSWHPLRRLLHLGRWGIEKAERLLS